MCVDLFLFLRIMLHSFKEEQVSFLMGFLRVLFDSITGLDLFALLEFRSHSLIVHTCDFPDICTL